MKVWDALIENMKIIDSSILINNYQSDVKELLLNKIIFIGENVKLEIYFNNFGITMTDLF